MINDFFLPNGNPFIPILWNEFIAMFLELGDVFVKLLKAGNSAQC